MKVLSRLYRFLLLGLPVVLYFSYHPVISLGKSETMNLELSVALIWLVLFDICGAVLLLCKHLMGGIMKSKTWRIALLLGFPIFVTLSALWSGNILRGVLTAGVMWLIIMAGIIVLTLAPVETNAKFQKKWMKIFLVGTLLVCAWCITQCVMDLLNVSREQTLFCAGCTYRMFGFPHPNGFAIEPQFMGNLLLAPAIVTGWMLLKKQNILSRRLLIFCFSVVVATLFLTFSRGAIYAFVVAMLFMTTFLFVQERKKRKQVGQGILKLGGMIVLSFVVVLNLQGLMAWVSPTNDTYRSGVAKVLNHLSLGIVDIREKQGENVVENDDIVDVENPVENFEEMESVFDGYVPESTDTRIRLTDAALSIWSKDFKTVMVGVGFGGAGQALFENDLSPSPKEIVQNEYASLLLETGIIGMALGVTALATAVFMIAKKWPSKLSLALTLLVAYGVTLCFFSGLPNALQVYLMPILLLVMI